MKRSLEFDFIGGLDPDAAPEQVDYYESFLEEFDRNPRLWLARGFVYEKQRGVWKPRPGNPKDSATGGVVVAGLASIKSVATRRCTMEARIGSSRLTRK
jgi:biofilm PGA synthesis N-glycosyltransferase PgaC